MRRAALLLAATLVLPGPPASSSRPVRVHALGDSITYGATLATATPLGVRRVDTPGGYRGELAQLLAAGGTTVQMIGTRSDNSTRLGPSADSHDGWPGWRVDMVDRSLDGSPFGKGRWITGADGRGPLHPDVVVVMLGTNDIWQRFDPGGRYPAGRVDYAVGWQRARFVQRLSVRLQHLVDHLQALRPGVRVVLADIAPMAPGAVGAPHAATRDYVGAVRALVAREQSRRGRVVMADVWTPMTRDGGRSVVPGLLSTDGIHPTPAGYALMGRVLATAVQDALRRWPVS